MEKIVIYGMGNDFQKYKHIILNMFNVVGCTDSYIGPSDDWEREHYIHLDKLAEQKIDKVLICSTKYQDAIGIGLVKKGFEAKQIILLKDILSGKSKGATYVKALKDIEKYEIENRSEKFKVKEESLFILDERSESAGKPLAHYFPQDIWAAQKIYHNNPLNHYDVGSSLNGFIAHLLVFREVNYIDIRPLDQNIPGLHYTQGDAVNLEKALGRNSIESLSSLSVMEHFGLGRYGDSIDPYAYIKAAKSMQSILKKEGHLYLSVPVGPKDKLVFNAHRIFQIKTVIDLFDQCSLADIAVASPTGAWFYQVDERDFKNVEEYSCGLFEFVKNK